MDSKPSRKRPHSGFEDNGDDDDINRQPPEKRVRFPKKKSKPGDEVATTSANVPQVAEDESEEAKVVAKAKSARRNQNKAGLTIDENGELLDVVAHSEMRYKDNEALEDDGTELMPFNLEEERKEGYFDQTGNYVEYINKDIKDAWLDSIADQPILAQKHSLVTNDVVEAADLTSQDIGSIKRRIADALESGETVLQALRRLKGTSNNRKEKMPAKTKAVFDQLTEDAMKLMEDGDYNVYHEKQEVFQREAEGFEKLARARGEGTSSSSGNIQIDTSGTNGAHAADDTTSVKEDDDFDMFAENDDETATDSTPNGTGPTQNDSVFDESSGYYYSSSLGYYYDASSGLYCHAASGLWYSYNQETGVCDEIPAGETNTSLVE
uniref:CD2 antigen cytoplasmic tail-binding protein 2-like isoform X1 n=1 Tax=Tanacetum cinerariifolium TaxID=118510 RepID=A0A6L2M4D4_TANCI|nr:CD2 antigen cytoplasmic tail-binding protein 2-like isoform X1 [Tanacetum cinerariifolium]